MAEGGRRFSSDDELPWDKKIPGKWRNLNESDPDSDDTGSTSAGEDFEWEEIFVKPLKENKDAKTNKGKTFSVPKTKGPLKPPRVDVDAPTIKSTNQLQPIQFKGLVKYPQREVYDFPKPPMLAATDFFGNPVERLPSVSDSEEESNIVPFEDFGLRGRSSMRKSKSKQSPELLRHCQFVHKYDEESQDADVRPKSKSKSGFVKSKGWLQSKLKPSRVKSKLTSMKELSGSFKSLMNVKQETEKPQKPCGGDPRMSVNAVLGLNLCPSFRQAFFLYIEGSMGIGKTSLIRHLREVSGENVVSFTEPMVYWREVFNDCIDEIYKATRPSNVGKQSTSSKILSAQMKFMTPFKCIQTSIRRYVKAQQPLQQKSPGDNWVVFDRHLMSPTLVFPLLFLKNGFLSFDHFMSLVSNFKANEGDIIALLCMTDEDNIKMVKKRNRKGEENISTSYLKEVSQSFHSCYCTWLLLRYFSPQEMLSVCCCDVSLDELCIMKSMSGERLIITKNLFSKSIFGVIMDVIEPFKDNCTIIEICLTLFMELKKLEFIVVNASEYIGDIPGVWTSIYMQTFKTQAIKTQTIDWVGLKAFSEVYNS